jgi:hypothetical protein
MCVFICIKMAPEPANSTDRPILYTDEELKNIENRIIGYIKGGAHMLTINESDNDITKDCKITAIIALHAKESGFSDELITAYTNSEHQCIRRFYGMCVMDSGEIRAHAVTTMMAFNNDVVGGIPLNELVRVKQWSESQIDRLNSGMIGGTLYDAFLSRDGWMRYLP